MTTQKKRRHIFINKKLQTKYVVQTIILLLIYTAFFISLLLAPYISSLLSGNPLQEQALVARLLLNMHNSSWPILAAMILLISLGTIFMTHRIAGPVYRIKKTLSEVAAGNLSTSIQLREKDDLKELSVNINDLIGDLREVVRFQHDNHASLSTCIAEIEEKLKNHQIDEASGLALLEQLKECRERTSMAMERYHFEQD